MMRKMFAGGNSSRGFYSLFDHMFSGEIEQIFLLKGGPGTGKSTLMQRLAQRAAAEGWPVELFFCSSDPDSLDGIVLPAQRAGVVDATAPHIQDPILPGCREEIINLGDNWDSSVLRQAKDEIAALTKANKAAYARAYRYLRAAEEMEGLWAQINSQYVHAAGISQTAGTLLQEVSLKLGAAPARRERHLFASAITPVGLVSHIGELAASYPQRWVLRWEPGTGIQDVFENLIHAARLAGVYMEIFHRPLLPDQIEHVLFPELGIAVLSEGEFTSPGLSGRVVDLRTLRRQDQVPQRVKDFHRELLEGAVQELAEAKAVHDELEKIYVSALDFARAEAVGQDLAIRIFGC